MQLQSGLQAAPGPVAAQGRRLRPLGDGGELGREPGQLRGRVGPGQGRQGLPGRVQVCTLPLDRALEVLGGGRGEPEVRGHPRKGKGSDVTLLHPSLEQEGGGGGGGWGETGR